MKINKLFVIDVALAIVPIFLIGMLVYFISFSIPLLADDSLIGCEKRFEGYINLNKEDKVKVMAVQNFILTEIVENGFLCAKHIAEKNKTEGYKDYFVALAYYFDYGDKKSYKKVYSSLEKFNRVCDYLKLKNTGKTNDCSVSHLMASFVSYEMENGYYEYLSGKEQLSSVYGNFSISGIYFPNAEVSKNIKYNFLNSEIIDKKRKLDFFSKVQKISYLFSYEILKALPLREGKDKEIFLLGKNIGTTKINHSLLGDINSLRGELKQQIDIIFYLKGNKEKLSSSEFYCRSRLFVMDLINSESFSINKYKNIYDNCIKHTDNIFDKKNSREFYM